MTLCVCPCPHTDPKILLLNIELELKSEKENAEVRLTPGHQEPPAVDDAWGLVACVSVRVCVCPVCDSSCVCSCVQVRLDDPAKYQSIVDAEWNIIYSKLAECANSGAQIVLSRYGPCPCGSRQRRSR